MLRDLQYRCLFFFQAEDGIRDGHVTGVQTCALPISTFFGHDGSFEYPIFININEQLQAINIAKYISNRSEERRVGKECRSRWTPYRRKKKKIKNEMLDG